MTKTDQAYGDEGREVDDSNATETVDGVTKESRDAPNLSADVVPTMGSLLPNGLPLLPGVGPDLAGPTDPTDP